MHSQFLIVFDTIPQILPDSVSYFLKEEIAEVQPDSFNIGFSEFEYLATDSSAVRFDVDAIAASFSQEVIHGFNGIRLPAFQSVHDIFFLLLLLCLALLAFFSKIEGSYFLAKFKEFFFTKSGRRSVYRDQVTASSAWGTAFLTFQFVLLSTMIAFSMVSSMDGGLKEMFHPVVVFSMLFSGLLLLVLLKYLVYRITDFVFPEWRFGEWVDKFFTLIGFGGLLLFIPTLFYVFTPEYEDAALFLIFIVIFIVLFVILRNLLNIFVKNRIGLLNYFLYLCAVEIVPFFLLYKGVQMLL